MTGRPLHVLMTVNASWNVLNFRLPLLRALCAQGHRVTVLAPEDAAVPGLQAEGAGCVPLVMDTKGLNPVRDAALVYRLARHFRAQAPDVVLSWTIKNNIFGACAARLVGVPFIPNVTGLGTAFLSGGPLQRMAETLYRAAFPRLDTVFFQNADDRALFCDRRLVRAGQARLLPGSGIDLARFAPAPQPDKVPDAGPVFLMIARLLRDKGVVEYAQAARIVRAAHPAVEFRLLGALGAENRSAIDAQTLQGWQAAGDIIYLGQTEDVRPAIAAADVVVLPSYREGAPRTLIEAAAMGRPLIATDVPGCRAVVDDGVSGYLCAVRDAASLAGACERMIACGPGARAAMGLAGRRKMEAEFDERIVVGAYLDAIARVTGRP